MEGFRKNLALRFVDSSKMLMINVDVVIVIINVVINVANLESTDDVGIVSYKWEEIKGPIKEKSVFASATDSKILQLKNLIAGVYDFK